MIWGSFASNQKGRMVIWDKSWGSMNAEKFIERIIPQIRYFSIDLLADGIEPLLQQDGASSHTARLTRQALAAATIETTSHPPYSPDLNPIENIWDWIKDYISQRYGSMVIALDDMKFVIQDAWDAVPKWLLESLVNSMPERVAEVIRQQGGPTHY